MPYNQPKLLVGFAISVRMNGHDLKSGKIMP
jgi:hypothetical protein